MGPEILVLLRSYYLLRRVLMKKFAGVLVALLFGGAAWAGPVQEKNKAVARRVFEEIFTRAKFEVANETYAPEFVNHGLRSSVGLKEDQEAARGWRDAFPDGKMAVVMMIAEDDLVTIDGDRNKHRAREWPARNREKNRVARYYRLAHRGWKDSRGMELI
jgi:predicted SnoaL-like aldol condensation-catalyzing enzyme